MHRVNNILELEFLLARVGPSEVAIGLTAHADDVRGAEAEFYNGEPLLLGECISRAAQIRWNRGANVVVVVDFVHVGSLGNLVRWCARCGNYHDR